MAITESDYENLQKQQKGLLDIDTQGFYFDNIRPFMKDMLLTCKTDKELLRTIEKVINASDSFCNDKNYEALNESFDILDTAITDANYFNGVMKKLILRFSVYKAFIRLRERSSSFNILSSCPYK